jgi:hypothetical protein
LAIYLVLLPLYLLPANSGGRMFKEAVH